MPTKQTTQSRFSVINLLWDAWCLLSVVGIWPRFIEPYLLCTSKLQVSIPSLPQSLDGLKIVQLTDLHLYEGISEKFLRKISKNIQDIKPDIIVFTGDFICYSRLDTPSILKDFLNSLHAPYGCYAILGNHDYEQFVSVNAKGDYDIIRPTSSLGMGFARFFHTLNLTKKTTSEAAGLKPNKQLVELLKDTPFKLLNNSTSTIHIKDAGLNITGLGEYMLKKMEPEIAFQGYDQRYPGLILLHNPDGAPLLQNYPGDIILSGHTHGGQINLPWMWKKFTLMEHMQYKKGLHHLGQKHLYVNRGVGSVIPFRWFSPPELLILELKSCQK